jgi:hypothetical protein
MWNPSTGWFNELRDLPRARSRKLLFVPKLIVRARLHYNADDYFNNYVLNFLAADEIANGTALVHLLKDRTPRVYKKDLRQKYGQGKRTATEITLENPGILEEYRSTRGATPPLPYSHLELTDQTDEDPVVDWDALADAIRSVRPGGTGATAFHRAAQAVLTTTLYPWLTMPVREREIHQGRKRIDISFTNAAKDGFFDWFADHWPGMNVVVECKNYTSDPANPELDQIAGRFSPRRGQIGLLVGRSFTDKQLFLERCRDTAIDGRGFVIPLDDEDLLYLVDRRRSNDMSAISALFRERYDYLAS